MSDDKKKYICKLPTNGFNAGDEAFLTDAEVANFNGGEEHPRFVLADEASAADAPGETPKEEETPAPETPADAPQATPATPTPEGEYVPDEPKEEETPAAPTNSSTTPPSTEGVE